MNELVTSRPPGGVRERILGAAYRLFSDRGIGAVGIDAIVAESGCAKSSLYNNFESKEELALEFLKDRENQWTREWLENSVRNGHTSAEARLLGIFDVFHHWFQRDDFEGCSFVNVMLESAKDSPVRKAAAEHLANIRDMVAEFTREAGFVRPDELAEVWHMLMKGSIVAAGEGNRDAARQAQRAGRLLLDSWARSW